MATEASTGAFLRARCPPVVVHTWSGSVVGETVVVVVYLTASVPKDRDDVIKRAEAVWVLGAAWIVADWDDGIISVAEYQICLLGSGEMLVTLDTMILTQ
jgi:hypothetical protein